MSIENNGELAVDGMSKLIYWEVWNFMSFDHAKFEFDDRNILNLVGYNNSGKSAALRALEINMYNRFPQSQLSFVKSGSDYFRVVSYWSDGVIILRDKYINGQSLYEMWKGDVCIFSSKQNGVLTKVADVPLCIQQYLNLVKFDDSYLNSRSCFEKQFLVQTSGGENYSALNTVLKSEELSLAGSLVNADRNKLGSDISVAEAEYTVKMKQYKDSLGITEDLVSAMKSHDKLLDVSDAKLISLGSLLDLSGKLAEIPDIPSVECVSFDELQLLEAILSCSKSISDLGDIPSIELVDSSRLELLVSVENIEAQLRGIIVLPEISGVSDSQLVDLVNVCNAFTRFIENEQEIQDIEERLSKLNAESVELENMLKEYGVRTVRCKNCGALVEVGGDGVEKQCC